ncbi:MAG: regulatory protein RecX [Nitrospira sp.]|nr:regulatory protein RecX [Nitrospira sp.]
MHEARKNGRIGSRRSVNARAHATPLSPDAVIQLAVRFVAHRDRTIAQVEQFLTSRGISSLQAKHAIRRLSDLRYLDDVAYAQRWVGRRLAARPMGQERLRAELQAKGIADSLAAQVVTEAFRTVNEDTLADRVLKAAQRRGRRLTSIQVGRLLHQRGFAEETIDHIIMTFRMNEECVHEE